MTIYPFCLKVDAMQIRQRSLAARTMLLLQSAKRAGYLARDTYRLFPFLRLVPTTSARGPQPELV